MRLAGWPSLALVQVLVPDRGTFLVLRDTNPKRFGDFLPVRFRTREADELGTMHGESLRIARRPVWNSHGDFGIALRVVTDRDDQCVHLTALERDEAVKHEDRADRAIRILREPLLASGR